MATLTVGRRAMCVAALLWACGGHEADNAGAGGAAAAGSGVQSSSSTGPGAPVFYASVVAEKQPGEAPAFLSLTNATDVYLTLFIGGAGWVAVPAGQTTDPELSATADVAAEIKIGYCLPDGGSCVLFHPNIKSGPNAWTPGKHYFITASGTKGAVDLDMVEQPGEPFVALRGWDKAHFAGGNTLHIELTGGASEVVVETPYNAKTDYALVAKGSDAPPQISHVRLTVAGAAGTEQGADLAATLSGAAGFTVVIDKTPVPGAVTSVVLK